jgi:hypothetical protein
VSGDPCEFAQMLGSVAAPAGCTCRNTDANEAREDMTKGLQPQHEATMITAITAIGMATAAGTIAFAATIGVAATANAGTGSFQSPSGNIFCAIGVGGVTCEIADHTYVLPPSPCEHSAWGRRFHMEQGSAPVIQCHNDTIRPSYSSPGPNPDVPILDYGHPQLAGLFTCDSEPSGLTCTDSSSGHLFRVSRESYQLG